MRAARTLARVLQQLLLCSLYPSSGLGATSPPVSMASASMATASWKTVWVDEFQSESVDLTSWECPERDLLKEDTAAGGRGDRQMNDFSSGSRPELPPHRPPSSSSPCYQVYIGAHDYLVMVGTPPPSLPYQTSDIEDQDAVLVAGGAAVSNPIVAISTSVDFIYGRVEVRAKVAPSGFSGFWLRSSEKNRIGHTPCARVAVAEIRQTKRDKGERSKPSVKGSVIFEDPEGGGSGCTNSDVWSQEDGGCSLSAEDGTDWSENFHVYSLEWEEGEFRWYVDGLHYCTKTSPDDFPAPFHKTFHFEMGLEATGGKRVGDTSAGQNGPSASSPVVAPEMLIDYVRIAQGPTGVLAPPADDSVGEGFALDADGGEVSAPPRAVDIFINALAVSACVLGPYMAMTGLRRPLANTILMGVEIGAFKGANASYLLFRSYVMALVGAISFGLIVGFLAIRHRAMARWNTVAGLAVPVLFLLIDVGMISDIGSRYVCWAIFFVLTVTFAVLVFPSEHHALGFAVASAATGSCVFKLGLGWLLGEAGEIFKILDDPLGDRCHVSRVCQYLNIVMGAVFLVGLCSQWVLSPPPEGKSAGGTCEFGVMKQQHTLFTPPRARFPSRGPVLQSDTLPGPARKSTASTSSDFALNDGREASGAAGEGPPAFGAVDGERERHQESLCPEDDDALSEGYDDDRAFILGRPEARRGRGGVWERASAGARRIIDRVLHPISSYRHHQVPVSVPPDSPTPVPMPPSGPESNTIVSNQGDTIELVIHSPHKGSLSHRQPLGWLGSAGGGNDSDGGGNDRGDHHGPMPQSSLRGGQGAEEKASRLPQEGIADGSASSSNDYDDALSILSASELVATDDPTAATSTNPLQTNAGASSGRLADAFSEKWGAWVQDVRSSDDRSAEEGEGFGHRGRGVTSAGGCSFGEEDGRGGGGGNGGRTARKFDHEALLLSPYVPPPPDVGSTPNLGVANPGAAESDDESDRRVASRLSCPSSSSSSVYDERWIWRHRDGVLPPSSSNDSSGRCSSQGGSAVAEGRALRDLGKNAVESTVAEEKSRQRSGELGVSSGTGPAEVVALENSGRQGASLREIDI